MGAKTRKKSHAFSRQKVTIFKIPSRMAISKGYKSIVYISIAYGYPEGKNMSILPFR